MLERRSLQYGMPVRGARGEHLGRVVACGENGFLVRSSVVTRRRFFVHYDEVVSLRRGMVRLRRGRDALGPPDQIRGPLMAVQPLNPRARTVAEAVG